ncbi:MAG: winged helix-turn-helix domain-containing protein [Streptomycetales bacterium]
MELLAQDLHQLREKAGEPLQSADQGNEPATGPTPLLRQGSAQPIASVLPRPAGNWTDGQLSPHEQIAADLREAIEVGKLRPGDVVPSVAALAGWYGVSVAMGQRAVKRLADEGRVTVRRGARTVVS